MFNLETAVATWLHSIKMERSLKEDDILELEDHLRNHIEELLSEGRTPEDSFREAIKRIGGRLEIGHAYQDIFWNKVHHRGSLQAELKARWTILVHYLKIGFRNLKRQRLLAGLNILGLAAGFSAILFIGLYVDDELKFDAMHEKADRIYRVEAIWDGDPFASSAMRTGPTLLRDFPQIESMVRLYHQEPLLQFDDRKVILKQAWYADSSLLNIFDFEVISGDSRTMLSRPGTIVLTESTARHLFGENNPLGEQILVDNAWSAEVTGVLKDASLRSHLPFEAFISLTTSEQRLPGDIWRDWFWTESYTYVLLAENVDASALSANFTDFEEEHIDPIGREQGMQYDLSLEKLSNLYLHSDALVPPGPTGNGGRIPVFVGIGILILLLAGFNFTNLATASSITRTKEIGVRKTMGAASGQLTGQFLLESVLTSLSGFLVALLAVRMALPFVSRIAGKQLSFDELLDPAYLFVILGLIVVVGLAAGLFPAVVLARVKAVSIMKGVLPGVGSGKTLRSVLITIQFAVAIVLVAGTLIVKDQLSFISSASLGITGETILVVDIGEDGDIQNARERIKGALMADPDVFSVTASSDSPGTNRNSARTVVENDAGEMKVQFSKLYFVDHDFVPTYDLELVAGRNFSIDRPADTDGAMIINERAAMVFEYDPPSEAIGKRFFQWGKEGVIVGVIKDFNFTSLHDRVRPLSMRVDQTENRHLSIKLRSDNWPETLARLETIWSEHVPHRPFDVRFLDDRLESLYASEIRFSNLLSLFAGLAILIGSLGLFGIASLISGQRFREIGIRKALGASISEIVILLSKETLVLILISGAIAAPLVWTYTSSWLENFAYRIEVPWLTIVGSVVVAVAIAWLSISHSALTAARMNPVDSIRNE